MFQTYGLWIQTGAIVLSALAAALTILWNTKIARRRATLDILLQEQSEASLINERTEYVRLRDAGHLAQYAMPDETGSDNAAIIRSILNRYELIAIGIQQGTVDGKIYKKWCRTTFVKDWIALKPFVTQIRQTAGTSVYLCNFEALGRKWANKQERSLM